MYVHTRCTSRVTTRSCDSVEKLTSHNRRAILDAGVRTPIARIGRGPVSVVAGRPGPRAMAEPMGTE
jgi:hypothetical protein